MAVYTEDCAHAQPRAVPVHAGLPCSHILRLSGLRVRLERAEGKAREGSSCVGLAARHSVLDGRSALLMWMPLAMHESTEEQGWLLTPHSCFPSLLSLPVELGCFPGRWAQDEC